MGFLDKITAAAPALPSRVVFYAPEKFGKSSFGAQAPNPIFAMTAGETGLLSLIESEQVAPTPHFPEDFLEWGSLVNSVIALREDKHDYRTLVIDTGNGAENLCTAYVCQSFFEGKWGDYASYGRGNELAQKEWARFLGLLDEVRLRRKMSILILHHAKVKTFNDPAHAKDWDQWKPEATDKLWMLTHKWADVIMAGRFEVQVVKDKAVSTGKRFLETVPSPAVVAGNRYGLPPKITAQDGAANLFAAFATALANAKKGSKKLAQQAAPQPKQEAPPPPQPEPTKPAAEPEKAKEPEPAKAAPTPEAPQVPVLNPTEPVNRETIDGILATSASLKMTWPTIRKDFSASVGFKPDVGGISELNQFQGHLLLSILKGIADGKPKRGKKTEGEKPEGAAA